jgi:hypothetical protein
MINTATSTTLDFAVSDVETVNSFHVLYNFLSRGLSLDLLNFFRIVFGSSSPTPVGRKSIEEGPAAGSSLFLYIYSWAANL